MLCSAAPEKVSALNLKRLKADNKTCGQSQKETPSFRMVFLFGIWQRAGLNSLPRPARSALNQEVRQGSREWLCHSWDAGKRVRASSPAPKNKTTLWVVLFFWNVPRAEARKGTSAARKTCWGHVLVPVCASRRGGQKDQSLSSLRTAMNASVGTCTVPRLRIFFLPSFCFSSSFFLRVMSPP